MINWLGRLSDLKEWCRNGLVRVGRWIMWSPLRFLGVVAVIVVGLVVLVQVRTADNGSGSSAGADSSASPSWPVATATKSRPPSASPSGTPTPATSASATHKRSLSGDKLGHAWLTGFLNRSHPDRATEWKDQIGDISSSDLVSTLGSEGTQKLEFDKLSTHRRWRVVKIATYKPPDPVAKTPTRVQLPYLVTVSDGKHRQRKPFVLTAYHGHRWIVSTAEQPYTSKGG